MATLKRDCPHCGAGQMTFTVPWSGHHPVRGVHFFNGVGICGGCGNSVAIFAHSAVTTNNPSSVSTDIEAAKYIVAGFWPTPKEPGVPRHLPEEFKAKLLEAEKSYAASINTGAAGLYRSLIDSTTKRQLTEAELKSAGTLEARIDRLAEKHVIPDGDYILDCTPGY